MNDFTIYFILNSDETSPFITTVFKIAYEAWIKTGHREQDWTWANATTKQIDDFGLGFETPTKNDSVLIYSKKPINGTSWIRLKGVGTSEKWKEVFTDIFNQIQPKSVEVNNDSSVIDENGKDNKNSNGNGNGLEMPKIAFLLGGLFTGYKALDSETIVGQVGFAGVSALCFVNYFKNE